LAKTKKKWRLLFHLGKRRCDHMLHDGRCNVRKNQLCADGRSQCAKGREACTIHQEQRYKYQPKSVPANLFVFCSFYRFTGSKMKRGEVKLKSRLIQSESVVLQSFKKFRKLVCDRVDGSQPVYLNEIIETSTKEGNHIHPHIQKTITGALWVNVRVDWLARQKVQCNRLDLEHQESWWICVSTTTGILNES
jgi:hypothetical protein